MLAPPPISLLYCISPGQVQSAAAVQSAAFSIGSRLCYSLISTIKTFPLTVPQSGYTIRLYKGKRREHKTSRVIRRIEYLKREAQELEGI